MPKMEPLQVQVDVTNNVMDEIRSVVRQELTVMREEIKKELMQSLLLDLVREMQLKGGRRFE